MTTYRSRKSVTGTIFAAIVAISASCLTLGSVIWPFGTAADQEIASAVARHAQVTFS
jgi:hypothetical protein